MTIYVVHKHGTKRGKAFVPNAYLGLVSNPDEHAKQEALEYFFEGYGKDDKPPVSYKEVRNAILIE